MQLNLMEREDIGLQNRADHQYPFLDHCDHCPIQYDRCADLAEHLNEQQLHISTDITAKNPDIENQKLTSDITEKTVISQLKL
jgi:hypothetical protein